MFTETKIIIDKIKQNPKLIIADDYEITIRKIAIQEHHFLLDNHHSISEQFKLCIGLRVIHRKQPGSSVTYSEDKESLNQLIEMAFYSAQNARVNPWFRFPLFKLNTSSERLSHEAENYFLVKHPHEVLSQIKPSSFPFEFLCEKYHFEKSTYFIKRKSDKAELFYTHCNDSHHWQSNYPPLFGKKKLLLNQSLNQESHFFSPSIKLIQNSNASQSKNRINFKDCDILMWPQVALSILQKIGPFFCMNTSFKESRLFEKRLNTSVANSSVQLIENASLKTNSRFIPWDDEGFHSIETKVIEKGILKSFLHDSQTAAKENRLSTGNFVRDFNFIPRIAPRNLFFERGQRSATELIRSIQFGYLIPFLYSIESLDEIGEKFLILAPLWEINHSEVVGFVANLKIEMSIFHFLESILETSSEIEYLENYGSPALRLKNLKANWERISS